MFKEATKKISLRDASNTGFDKTSTQNIKSACGYQFKVIDDPESYIGPLPVEKTRMCSFKTAIAGQHVAILTDFLVIQLVGTVVSTVPTGRISEFPVTF